MSTRPVVMWAAGGSDIGIGHLARTQCITEELLAREVQVSVVLEAPEDTAAPFVLAPEHTAVVASGHGLDPVVARIVDGATVVTDHPRLDGHHSDALRAAGAGVLVHLTHSGADRYGADLLIDGDPVLVPFDSRIPIHVQGARYHPLARAVREQRPAAPWVGTTARRVLVVLGGADPGRCTETLAASIDPERLHATFVAGPAWDTTRVAALTERAPGRVLHAPDVARAIATHDLVVTLGGLTSYEAMALGRPVAAIRWDHMTRSVAALAHAELLADLGTIRDAPTGLTALAADGPTLRALAARGFQTFDGHGATRLVDLVLDPSQAKDLACA